MRASDYREAAEQLRADGLTTGQIIERWTAERGLNPREAARLSHGWTQQQTAEQWNALWPDPEHPCTRKHVSNWETGRQPSLETLNRLARVYRCAAGDLLGGEDYSHLDGRRARPGAAVLAVAVTVVVHDGAVLLVRSRGGGWQFPSGVVKPGQDGAERRRGDRRRNRRPVRHGVRARRPGAPRVRGVVQLLSRRLPGRADRERPAGGDQRCCVGAGRAFPHVGSAHSACAQDRAGRRQ